VVPCEFDWAAAPMLDLSPIGPRSNRGRRSGGL